MAQFRASNRTENRSVRVKLPRWTSPEIVYSRTLSWRLRGVPRPIIEKPNRLGCYTDHHPHSGLILDVSCDGERIAD